MTSKTEALKLALEALENHCGNYKLDDAGCERWNKAVAAIKEALAPTSTQCEVQPEQEPVALVVSTAPDRIWLDLGFDPQDEYEVIFHELHDVTWSQDNASGNGIEYVRADTTPPKRPWVGLTEDEVIDVFKEKNAMKFARGVEAKLKELNT